MANQTITTSVNYDAAAIGGLLNGETITVNAGGFLTIDADMRWNQQAAVVGFMSMNSSGSLLIDGTQIWELPFTASTGNVPTQGALGANGVTGGTSGATGELTRVWATGSLTPAAAAGAMPATGFVKLRSKTGTFQAGEIVTLPGGATITLANAGKRSWIHAVGAENTFIQSGSLTGTYNITGDWYELGTTNGTDDQTFQFPVADHCPVLWIETASGSGVYECWLNAGSRWGTATQFIPTTGERGKWFGIDITTGIITIARRATNACGTKPPSGCKVRIGNIICSNSNSTNWDANTFPTNTEQRYRIQGPPYVASKITSNWYHSTVRASLSDSGVSHALSGGTNMTRVGVGIAGTVAANNNVTSIYFNNSVLGCNWTDVRIGAYGRTGQAIVFFNSVNNVTWIRVRVDCFADTTTTTRAAAMPWIDIRASNSITIDDFTTIGTQTNITSCTSLSITNHKYADLMFGTTVAAGLQNAILFQGNCQNVSLSGFTAFDSLANVHPYNGLYNLDTYNNFSISDIGTPTAPYDFGTVNPGRRIATLNAGEGLLMRRVYTINPATQNILISGGAANRSIQFINVWGNGSLVTNWNFTDGVIIRGCRWGLLTSPIGQAAGTYFNDVLSTDSAGAIEAIFSAATTSVVSSGQLSQNGTYLKNIGDSMTVEMDYFSLGHTGFSSVTVGVTNQTAEFQYDTGSGWNGTWLLVTNANATAIGAIDPTTGIKLKVRVTATAANATQGIVRFNTSTTTAAAQTQYPLPVPTYTGAITNIISGSWMQIYNETQNNELYNAVINATDYTTTFSLGGDYNNGDIIRVRLTYTNGVTAKLGFEARAEVNNGWAIFADQVDDVVYNAIGLDGSTITEFSADYPNIQIDLNDPDYETTVHRLYAWWAYNLVSADGIAYWFGGLVAEDIANFKVITSILDLQLDNVASTAVNFTGGIRLYRDDGSSPVVTATTGGGSIILYADKVYVVNDPTPTEIADTILRRSTANIESSTQGDPLTLKSLYGMIAQGVHNTQVSGATLTVTKSDDVTTLGTRTVTTNSEALPIVGIDSD